MPNESSYDTCSGRELSERLCVPHVDVHDEVDSTMDVAHALAEAGALAGTIVLADRQRRGRGRGGKAWESNAGRGIWMTIIERPVDASALHVLSLRVGLEVADALDAFLDADRARLKWPNDLMTREGKLAGILTEARWRASHPEWVAIGIGINVAAPVGVAGAASLGSGVSRVAVLARVVPAMRRAATADGALTPNELSAYAARDWARGRRAVAPVSGTVRGITSAGALLVEHEGTCETCASGSLILEESLP